MNDTLVHHRFIEPLDVLFLRGNKLFGDPGSHGESLVPPWPSVAAGALRSAMLASEGIDLHDFAAGRVDHPALGTPTRPGPFTVVGFTLARRLADGRVESLHALPADLVAESEAAADGQQRITRLRRLSPVAPAAGLMSSAPLPLWPALTQHDRAKAASGLWLTQRGWAAYLAGQTPDVSELVRSSALWKLDARVGVGLDAATGRAADQKLFSMQAVAFHRGVGFLAKVAGAEPPEGGVLRLGGDGRGAAVRVPRHQPATADLAAIAKTRRCRVVLSTPGLFTEGWRLPGLDAEQRLHWPGLSARFACAAVPRADVVSGWDLARRVPKAAMRAAPTGSVYWLDELDATPQALGKLAEAGLWFGDGEDAARRAEGFNRFTFAAW
jgi:CRISPR-associated protein Cmr3